MTRAAAPRRRSLHPVAWWLWAAGLAICAMRTNNPFLLALIGAVVAEFVGSDSGLGYLVVSAASDFNVTRQFAAILLLSALGMAFFWVTELAERYLLPWHVSNRRQE